jgi:hypothetical protein
MYMRILTTSVGCAIIIFVAHSPTGKFFARGRNQTGKARPPLLAHYSQQVPENCCWAVGAAVTR